MKRNNCFYKWRNGEYSKQIYRCYSEDMYTKLTYMRISCGGITYIYGKTRVTVM